MAVTYPRILTFDIETAPLRALTWGIWEQNISLDQIEDDWSILCYCAKWYGEKELIYDYTGGRGKNKVRDDKKLVFGLRNLLDEADIVVAQNGLNFDLKKVDMRLLIHGYKPYSPVKVVDTMLVTKHRFAATSTKLAYLSKTLTDTPKDEHKAFPGFELWLECLRDNPKAWAEMKKYNCRDVVATEKVYKRLLPWIKNHPNVGAYIQDKERRCTKCGSKDLQRRGYALTMQNSYPRYQCNDCGGWLRGKQTELAREVRKSLLTNAL